MPFFTDQTGNTIKIDGPPQRVISLVPSQTELLFDLGLNERVIGITKFCVRPDSWFRSKVRVGGTKNLKMEIIRSLEPHLVIANKEENVKEQVEELMRHYPVWISDVSDYNNALHMIRSLGQITGTVEKATWLINKIEDAFGKLRLKSSNFASGIRTAYLIWQEPFMAAGGDTFIHEMMKECRFINIFKDISRYPMVTIDTIRSLHCELLLLSSEPYPFRQQHLEVLQLQLPDTKILLVDGEMFSWYGSRLLEAPAYFEKLLVAVQQ